jgi:hypothetical protein
VTASSLVKTFWVMHYIEVEFFFLTIFNIFPPGKRYTIRWYSPQGYSPDLIFLYIVCTVHQTFFFQEGGLQYTVQKGSDVISGNVMCHLTVLSICCKIVILFTLQTTNSCLHVQYFLTGRNRFSLQNEPEVSVLYTQYMYKYTVTVQSVTGIVNLKFNKYK